MGTRKCNNSELPDTPLDITGVKLSNEMPSVVTKDFRNSTVGNEIAITSMMKKIIKIIKKLVFINIQHLKISLWN